MNEAARQILNRAGWVLIVPSIIFAMLSVRIEAGPGSIKFHAGGDLFVLVVGILLLRAVIRVVGAIQWVALIYVVVTALDACFTLITTPRGLLFAELDSLGIGDAITSFVRFALALWLVAELQRPEVISARQASPGKVRSLAIPGAIGTALITFMAGSLWISVHGADATHALELAAAQMGPEFRYYLEWVGSRKGGRMMASVTAWKGREIRHLTVQWQP